MGHLKQKMLQYVDSITLNQLKDAGLQFFEEKKNFALSEMFSIELKFTNGILLKWFTNIYKSRFNELDMITKQFFVLKIEIKLIESKQHVSFMILSYQSAQALEKIVNK